MIQFVCNAQLRKLPVEFEQWLSSDGMSHATVSLEIAHLKYDGTSDIIYAYDNQRSMQPASIMKLVTTSAALSLLDPASTVPTEVYIDGEVSDGVLRGNLIVRGFGNAMLSSSRGQFPKDAFVNSIVQALTKMGIKSITGNVVGDGSALTDNPIPGEWTWEDMGNYYAPSISGLNYADNRMDIVFDTSQKGKKPSVIEIVPRLDGVTVTNKLSSKNYPSDSAYVFGAPGQLNRVVYGAVPHRAPTFVVKADVPDPALFAATIIKDALLQKGIKIEGKSISIDTWGKEQTDDSNTPDYSKLALLYRHESEPLSYIARQTNLYSINLFAEMLLRQIALKYGDGSEIAGIKRVMKFLDEKAIDRGGVRMYDGCGLAPLDRVTTHFMNLLLCQMKEDRHFVNSLPVAGRSGTIASFLKDTRLEGKAHLKTGTTKSVIAYSGYVDGSDKNRYAVTVIVNNHGCESSKVRKNIEKMLLLLIP